MFDAVNLANNVDEYLELMFEIKGAANELHLEQLMLLCSRAIMRHITIHNTSHILSEASYLHSWPLVNKAQEYMAVNLEALLEGRFLEDLSQENVKELAKFIRKRQLDKAPVTRSTKLYDTAFDKFETWLSMQDIPRPIVPTPRQGALRDGPRLSPPTPRKQAPKAVTVTSIRPDIPVNRVSSSNFGDDSVFTMDETLQTPGTSPPKCNLSGATWKVAGGSVKADLKSIMAEAEGSRVNETRAALGSSPRLPSTPKSAQREWRRAPSQTTPLLSDSGTSPRVAGASPWKIPTPSQEVPSPELFGSLKRLSQPETPPVRAQAGPAVPHPRQPSTQSKSGPQPSSLGPVITPSRLPSSSKLDSPQQRRTTAGSTKAWSPVPMQALSAPVTAAPAQSFAEIQAMQIQQTMVPEKDKRSLIEIQEEERARQAEADFLKWWANEEERVRLESQAEAAAIASSSSPKSERKPRKGKAPKPKPADARPKHSEERLPGHPLGESPTGLMRPSEDGTGHVRDKPSRRGGRGGRGASRHASNSFGPPQMNECRTPGGNHNSRNLQSRPVTSAI